MLSSAIDLSDKSGAAPLVQPLGTGRVRLYPIFPR
jgi:hypothetical protein